MTSRSLSLFLSLTAVRDQALEPSNPSCRKGLGFMLETALHRWSQYKTDKRISYVSSC